MTDHNAGAPDYIGITTGTEIIAIVNNPAVADMIVEAVRRKDHLTLGQIEIDEELSVIDAFVSEEPSAHMVAVINAALAAGTLALRQGRIVETL